MQKEKKTKSEILFEELCTLHNIPCVKLPKLDHRKQPDNELNFSGNKAIFEIKQVDPNDDDKAFHDTLSLQGLATQNRNPDRVAERVRNLIKKARNQIKSYHAMTSPVPAVVVIYDNANNLYTDPYTIQTAMFGWERVQLNVHRDTRSSEVADRGFGERNNKIIREDKYIEISAIATLHECWHFETHERFLAMCFYHNSHADQCFDPIWWQCEKVQHLRLSKKTQGQYQNWESINK